MGPEFADLCGFVSSIAVLCFALRILQGRCAPCASCPPARRSASTVRCAALKGLGFFAVGLAADFELLADWRPSSVDRLPRSRAGAGISGSVKALPGEALDVGAWSAEDGPCTFFSLRNSRSTRAFSKARCFFAFERWRMAGWCDFPLLPPRRGLSPLVVGSRLPIFFVFGDAMLWPSL